MARAFLVHDKPSALPPLRIKRKGARDELLRDRHVKSLLGLGGKLLTGDFVGLLQELFPVQAVGPPMWSLIARTFAPLEPLKTQMTFELPNDLFTNSVFRVSASSMFDKAIGILETSEQPANVAWKVFENNMREAAIERSIKSSDQLQSLISAFETKVGADIAVTTTVTLYVCPKCKSELGRGKFRQAKCTCGQKAERPSDAQQIALTVLADEVKPFWADNIWLEEGVAYHFRRERFDVITGINVLGGSGVDHEIDILAHRTKPVLRVFCECKHREIKPNDVLVFAGKVRDIGGQAAMMFTTAASVDDRVRRLARANGVQVVESVLGKPVEEWAGILV